MPFRMMIQSDTPRNGFLFGDKKGPWNVDKISDRIVNVCAVRSWRSGCGHGCAGNWTALGRGDFTRVAAANSLIGRLRVRFIRPAIGQFRVRFIRPSPYAPHNSDGIMAVCVGGLGVCEAFVTTIPVPLCLNPTGL